jgi:hypothetical protein
MGEVVRHPAFITTWIVVLLAVAVCGGLLLSTEVGRQALVDERVRVTEALGRRVDDASTRGCRPIRRCSVYLTSGGRLLLTPPMTAGGAAGLMRWRGSMACGWRSRPPGDRGARHGGARGATTGRDAGALRTESLTSPTTLAGILRVFDEGTWPSRLFGTIDVFGLWWMWLLSVGRGAAARRPADDIYGGWWPSM